MQDLAVQKRVRSPAYRIQVGAAILLLHLIVVSALIIGGTRSDWLLFAFIYPFQSVGVGVAMHRYFSHRSFKTSRAFQFFLGLCAAFVFGNAVGFAGKHRLHHQHVDNGRDVHTPLHGIWACWIGSLMDNGYTDEQILHKVSDFTAYPELMWLYRNPRIPGLVLCAIAFAIGGFTSVGIGVCLGSVLLLHQSSAVNYLAHKYGRRRFDTPDKSTNNWFIGIVSFGDGWHNNHHRYPRSARTGFFWWEIDMFFWAIWLFEKLGLVWDVRRPPAEVYSSGKLLEPAREASAS